MSKILKSFEINKRALKSYLWRFFKEPQDIEDIMQEVFLRAFAMELKVEIRFPKSFLFRIAKNIAINEIKRRSKNIALHGEDFFDPDASNNISTPTAEEEIESRRKLELFIKAVALMPPACRKVFIMRNIDGLKVKDIARKMNISVSGVEKHLAVGLVKCSQYFREQGYEPEDFGPKASAKMRQIKDPLKE